MHAELLYIACILMRTPGPPTTLNLYILYCYVLRLRGSFLGSTTVSSLRPRTRPLPFAVTPLTHLDSTPHYSSI